MGNRGPRTIGGSPVTLSVYVDAVFVHAVSLGATALRPVAEAMGG